MKVTNFALEEVTDLLQQNIYGDITSKGSKILYGYFPSCNGKQSTTASDNTIVAEGLNDFFKNQGKKGHKMSENIAKKRNKEPRTSFR